MITDILKNMLSSHNKELTQIYNISEKSKTLKKSLEIWNEKQKEIQANFDFIVPNYIIDEIIYLEPSKDYSKLHSLLLLAVYNRRISMEEAVKIEQVYC